MEHRWGRRLATDIEVRLFCLPASIGRGRLRDVSASGGFIETKLVLASPSALRITFPASDDSRDETRTVHAFVVRRSRDGVGVEWSDVPSGVIAGLLRVAAGASTRVPCSSRVLGAQRTQ